MFGNQSNMVENESRNYHEYGQFNPRNPQKYIFEGNALFNLISSSITFCLLVFVYILSKKIPCTLRFFTYTVSLPMLLNLIPRIIRSLYILLFRYPTVYSLFWLATFERTLHIATHFIIVMSILLYSHSFSASLVNSGCRKSYIFLSVLCSFYGSLTALLFFNFNLSLDYFPMGIYFVSAWFSTIITVFILCVSVPLRWREYTENEKQKEQLEEMAKIRRGWITVATFGSLPVIYLTVGTIIDACYELNNTSDSINILFIGFNEFRMIAYYLQSTFILAFLLLFMPQYSTQVRLPSRKNTVEDEIEKKGDPTDEESNSPRIQISLKTRSQPVSKFPKEKQIMAPIEKVKAGGLNLLNPVLYPGAAPTATNITVIRGALGRLDPGIYPGAADSNDLANTPAPEIVVIEANSVSMKE